MRATEFCYWLQGFFELSHEQTQVLNSEQVDTIRRHLALVFKHEIDPSYGPNQEELQNIHDKPSVLKPSGQSGELYRC